MPLGSNSLLGGDFVSFEPLQSDWGRLLSRTEFTYPLRGRIYLGDDFTGIHQEYRHRKKRHICKVLLQFDFFSWSTKLISSRSVSSEIEVLTDESRMTAARNLERDFQNLYVTEGNSQGGQVIRHHRPAPAHPLKNGLPTFTPVIYPNPADQSDESEEEDYPQSSSGYQVQRSQYYAPQSVSVSYAAPKTYTATSYSPLNTTAPLPFIRAQAPTAPSGGGERARRPDPQPEFPPPPPTSHDSFYEDEEDYLPPPVPNQMSYGTYSSQMEPRSVSPYMTGGRPVSPGYPSVRVGPSAYQDRRDYAPKAPNPAPQPVTEGARSRIMFTSTATPIQQGFVQSRPTNAMGEAPTGYKPTPTSPQVASGVPSGSRGDSDVKYAYPGKVPLPSDQPISSPSAEGKEAEVDALTSLLMQNMEAAADPDFFGMCAKCGAAIMGENTGCSALDQLYHVDCFTCRACGMCLGGQPFFAMENKPYCENCYLNTLEKCSVCSKAITDRILRATGKPYHPTCFMCVVCGKSLDGVPFTVDATSQIHCIEDFHKKFAPRCCVCNHPIMPEQGQEETVRIVAMDKSFHVHCYQCEDCGLLLSSEAEGRGCYPLDDSILCKNCNAKRIQALTTKMTTEL